MRHNLARGGAVFMFVLALTPPADPTETAGPTAIDIKLFAFQPKEIDVTVGARIRWTNQDGIEHSITHGVPEARGGTFDSGFIGKGQGFTATFGEAGEFPYFCARHLSMRGTVRVRTKP